jgi:hypothetical protein
MDVIVQIGKLLVKVKAKVKFSLYIIRHYAIKTRGGVAPSFLTSTLNGSEWPDSRAGRFTRGKEAVVPIG